MAGPERPVGERPLPPAVSWMGRRSNGDTTDQLAHFHTDWPAANGGIGDNIGSGSYFVNNPKGLLGNNSGQFLNNQDFSMYGWSSISSSSYNALQATLRQQFNHGVQFDLYYTSRSR